MSQETVTFSKMEIMENNKHIVCFNTRDELTRVCIEDIMLVSSDGNYATIILASGRNVNLLTSISNIYNVLESMSFTEMVRLGRSHIINLHYLRQINILRHTITIACEQTKEVIVLPAAKEAVRQLRDHIMQNKMDLLPEFQCSNGKMTAYLEKEDGDS